VINISSSRSKKIRFNIVSLFLIKIAITLVGFASVPVIINLINPEVYGVWVTITAIVGWFGMFDLGLGNGLRNKLAIALACNDWILARKYVSTTYAVLTIITVAIYTVFFTIEPYLDWKIVLGVPEMILTGHTLSLVVKTVMLLFCINLVVKVLGSIFYSLQSPFVTSFIDLIAKVFSYIALLLLNSGNEMNVLSVTFIVSATPIIIYVFASIVFFSTKYKAMRPALSDIELSRFRELMGLGSSFFFIQLSAVLLYQTNTLVISHLFGPLSVTSYTLANRYIGAVMILFSIVVAPFWSATTEAYEKGDKKWISKSLTSLKIAWLMLVVMGLAMYMVSSQVFSLWVGDEVAVPKILTLSVFVWVAINMWNSIYSNLLNGIGKVRLQLIIGVSSAALNVPLAIYLGKLIGIEGVVLANILVLLPSIFIYPAQFEGIIQEKSHGIWNK